MRISDWSSDVCSSDLRQRITERTAAGRVQAKARGVKFGRRAALTPHQQAEALQRLAAGDPHRTVAAMFDVDQATISRLARRSRGSLIVSAEQTTETPTIGFRRGRKSVVSGRRGSVRVKRGGQRR